MTTAGIASSQAPNNVTKPAQTLNFSFDLCLRHGGILRPTSSFGRQSAVWGGTIMLPEFGDGARRRRLEPLPPIDDPRPTASARAESPATAPNPQVQRRATSFGNAARQPALSFALLAIMQDFTASTFGIAEKQRRKASGVHAARCASVTS
jgi:hypothetical protein